MAEEDGLLGFFDEINQIEEATTLIENNNETNKDNINEEGPRIKKIKIDQNPQQEQHQTIISTSQVQIISKPSNVSIGPDMPSSSYRPPSTIDRPIEHSITSQPTVILASHHDPCSFHKKQVIIEAKTVILPPSQIVRPVIEKSTKRFVRTGAGETWVDDTLTEWPENDFRLFIGDLAKETTTEMLAAAFSQYKSFAKAKVITPKSLTKARGYGFVSFIDPMDCAKALREQNGKYLGNTFYLFIYLKQKYNNFILISISLLLLGTRPMKITKSDWKTRDLKEVKKKEKNKRKMQESLGLL
jgi:hypothetical protein